MRHAKSLVRGIDPDHRLHGGLDGSRRTINVSDDHGGSVAAYSQRWKGLAARGVNVRIVGKCQSACTVLLGYIPRSRICVTPAASFGFHLAHRTDMTAVLWNAYAADIRGWINAHGGLASQLKWMNAPAPTAISTDADAPSG
ncbi:hypothetical protein P9228_18090 [Mesorhizobium sp. WSM4898]|uniref:hypothetical protein n=1 Tax=Mesorhizobium sp. WSM4898 TaxID=3038544 RepID=UPI0024155F19|nr:hypothetical protein [Mesorhizobium sp. WSM4898]MDG4908340.1 hypothetical protein [Mesorhizobium sp. WSM4898]